MLGRKDVESEVVGVKSREKWKLMEQLIDTIMYIMSRFADIEAKKVTNK